MNRTIAIALLALGGCSFNAGSLSSGDAGDAPIGDDGPVDAPDAGPCTSASATCSGDTLSVCTGAGATPAVTQCDWGCDMTAGRCTEVVPAANALVAMDLTGTFTGDALLSAGTVIDTDAGTITGVSNPDTSVVNNVRVFRLNSLHVIGDITVVGSNALAIAVDGTVDIGGMIDVRGTCTANAAGPGGFAGGTNGSDGAGPGGGTATNTNKIAGGGGGHGGIGGDGATDTTATSAGGSPYDDTLTMLRGGSGGGGGGGGGHAVGGGGGGAIQIVSNDSITFGSGGINAGGCGGETKSGAMDGGGGGGAGGTIVLEAPIVSVPTGVALTVNGGGGGGGDGAATPVDGQDATPSTTPASGGQSEVGTNGGAGAAGATVDGAAGTMVSTKPGGGGGGAVGRIWINARGVSNVMIDAAAIISPTADATGSTLTVGSAKLQ